MGIIQIDALSKFYGHIHAVSNISFKVECGEVLGFLGPNGAGKSTTMKMIAGFLEPTHGTVIIKGHNVLESPLEAKRAIGYLPEGAPAYAEMTVRQFLNFIADIRQISKAQRKKRIDEIINIIHLEQVIDQVVDTLSKGYKRRVGLAQAIFHDPEILILDEPTDGLDPNQKYEVRNLIKKMAQNKAIVISTHILEEVDALCSRAIIIASGKLLFDGSPDELLQHSEKNDLDHAFRMITTNAQQRT